MKERSKTFMGELYYDETEPIKVNEVIQDLLDEDYVIVKVVLFRGNERHIVRKGFELKQAIILSYDSAKIAFYKPATKPEKTSVIEEVSELDSLLDEQPKAVSPLDGENCSISLNESIDEIDSFNEEFEGIQDYIVED